MKGKLKIVNEESNQEYFWVTHRLSAGEVLTGEAGKKLGSELNGLAGKAKHIELDIEPLKDPATVTEFLKGVRETLSPELKLTIAAPFTAETKSEANSWTREQFEHVIGYVDGIELMVYDTGAKTKEEYLGLFENNLSAAGAWQELYPSKIFTVGLPAYPDKTKLHRPAVESLAVVSESALLKSGKFSKMRFAVYAGWTLTEEDKKLIDKLREQLTSPKPLSSKSVSP